MELLPSHLEPGRDLFADLGYDDDPYAAQVMLTDYRSSMNVGSPELGRPNLAEPYGVVPDEIADSYGEGDGGGGGAIGAIIGLATVGFTTGIALHQQKKQRDAAAAAQKRQQKLAAAQAKAAARAARGKGKDGGTSWLLIGGVLLVGLPVLGAGGYFGYQWWKDKD